MLDGHALLTRDVFDERVPSRTCMYFAINHARFISANVVGARVTQMDGREEIKMNNCAKQQMAEAEARHVHNVGDADKSTRSETWRNDENGKEERRRSPDEEECGSTCEPETRGLYLHVFIDFASNF